MNDTVINFVERFGTDVSSRWRAAELRAEIARTVDRGTSPCSIDLAGVRTVSDSFADEAFAILVVERGDEWFRKNVRLLNLSTELRTSILGSILNRLESEVGTP